MKAIVFIISLFLTSAIYGQTMELKKCGLNDNPTLNEYEAKYFNEVFLDRKGRFDFTNKYVAYFTGSTGKTKSNKSNYFAGLQSGNEDIHSWQAGGTQLLILTEEEKELSGGYDVILVSWSKLGIVGKSRERLVKQLKNTL